jgi:DNA processing protein
MIANLTTTTTIPNSSYLPYWLAALYLPQVGPRTFMRWLAHFSDIQTLFHAQHEALLAAGLTPQEIAALKQPDWASVERDLAWADETLHHHIIAITDSHYPRLLKEIVDPPLLLYVSGNKLALDKVQIAIVGSRHATPNGLKNAEWFASSLVQAGFAITSGLALGVDASSHRGALTAKGITVGVAGAGLHHIYPRVHKALVAEILENDGAIISEFPLSLGPHATHFPRRNRVVSGLSVGTLVVEAALKSGSLITARHALEQGREVFALPGSIHNPLARGCHHLIRQGATLVESAQDITAELSALLALMKMPKVNLEVNSKVNSEVNSEVKTFTSASTSASKFPKKQRQVFELIDYEITAMDVILLRSGLTAGEVSSILLALELDGHIQSVTGGYIRTIQR